MNLIIVRSNSTRVLERRLQCWTESIRSQLAFTPVLLELFVHDWQFDKSLISAHHEMQYFFATSGVCTSRTPFESAIRTIMGILFSSPTQARLITVRNFCNVRGQEIGRIPGHTPNEVFRAPRP